MYSSLHSWTLSRLLNANAQLIDLTPPRGPVAKCHIAVEPEVSGEFPARIQVIPRVYLCLCPPHLIDHRSRSPSTRKHKRVRTVSAGLRDTGPAFYLTNDPQTTAERLDQYRTRTGPICIVPNTHRLEPFRPFFAPFSLQPTEIDTRVTKTTQGSGEARGHAGLTRIVFERIDFGTAPGLTTATVVRDYSGIRQ